MKKTLYFSANPFDEIWQKKVVDTILSNSETIYNDRPLGLKQATLEGTGSLLVYKGIKPQLLKPGQKRDDQEYAQATLKTDEFVIYLNNELSTMVWEQVKNK